jgi:lysozyme
VTYSADKLRQELIRDEGIRLEPYRDSLGYLTIGVGHLIKRGESFTTLTHQQAMDLLDSDIAIAERNLTNIYPKWRELDDVRQRTLINLSFNLGGKLAQFKRFLHSLSLGNFGRAADQLIQSKWYRQVRLRGPRIVHAMRTGTEWVGK